MKKCRWSSCGAALAASLFAVTFLVMIYGGPHVLFHDWARGAVTPGTSDPDTWMRLAFIEHGLKNGTLTDYWFPRDGAPGGTELIWSLPFDAAVAGLALLFRPFAGWHDAISYSVPLHAPIWLIAEAASAAVLARAMGARGLYTWTVSLAVLAPALVGYAHIGRVGHHPATVTAATLAVALAILFFRAPSSRNGMAAGLAVVLASWLSMETLPLVLGSCGIVWGAAALRGQRAHHGLRSYAFTTSILSLCALLIDPPYRGVDALITDRFSLFHVIMLILGSHATLAVALARSKTLSSPTARVCRAALVTIPFAICGLYVASLSHLPANLSDPEVYSFFWQQDQENRAVFRVVGSWPLLAIQQPLGLICLIFAAMRARRRATRYALWAGVAVLLCEILLGVVSIRLSGYSALTAIAAVAATVRPHAHRAMQKAPGWFAPVCFLFVSVALLTITRGEGQTDRTEDCSISLEAASSLAASLPQDAIVAADIWMSPEFLWRVPTIRTIAGPYHPNVSGLRDLAALMTTTDDGRAMSIMKNRTVDAVLICTAPAHNDLTVFHAGSLQQRLTAGQVPPWLKPVSIQGDAPNLRLFRRVEQP